MSKQKLTVNRELSWLSFNERVLQEAADPNVPLIERLKFLGIFSSNLDEFYRVRVATIKRLIRYRSRQGMPESNHEDLQSPSMLLKLIQQRVIKQRKKFDELYHKIKKELALNRVHIISEQEVTNEQGSIIRSYFRKEVIRKLSPILLDDDEDFEFPVLKDKLIYFVIRLENSKRKLKNRFVLLEIPTSTLPRFYVLPKQGRETYIIMLDDVIRYNFKELFSIFDYENYDAYTIKITRDAELDLDDDISKSYLQKLSKSLKERKVGRPVRLTYDKDIPEGILHYIRLKLKLKEGDDLIAGARYHNFKDFVSFPKVGKRSLMNTEHVPIAHYAAPKFERLFELIKKRDLLMHYPYHSFDYNLDLLREAAMDPYVTDIKMTIYRVASPSGIINALINAIKNGKNVTVLVEVQARFDEEANIKWANKLSDEGARVIEGVPGLKVHSKLILIRRKIRGKVERYGVLGTGNFHEKTANLYSDTSLFTSNNALLAEAEKVFEFFETNYKTGSYEHLLIAPFFMRDQYYKLIDHEIELAKAGEKAYVHVKVNSLVDDGMVNKLYEASNAGVKIKLIVRGICSLIPGLKGVSENIEVVSIVDKFLEHSRVFIFSNGGDEKIYLSSADWMRRNLSFRTEVSVPIYDPKLKKELRDFFNIQWKDNVKSRIIDQFQSNKYRRKGRKKIRAQEEFYLYLKNKFDAQL